MRIVIALGGNALGDSPDKQWTEIEKAAHVFAELVKEGHKLVVVHGNGPQVGMIFEAFQVSHQQDGTLPPMHLSDCVSMSQGYMGFPLQNKIKEALEQREVDTSVATVITQALVDDNDSAFSKPTKPIGRFFTKEEGVEEEKKGIFIMEDANRGYRQAVFSPKPKKILECETIDLLLAHNHVVVSAGGGGIPVYEKNGCLLPVEAVIDKDFSAAKLADQIQADKLIILTAVEKVSLYFGTEKEQQVDEIPLSQIDRLISENHFAPGSMLPKIEAAKEFVAGGEKRVALITSLEKAVLGLQGKTGTKILNT